ncbi:MAG: hypothetical protein RL761_858, partial [Pseudomonadota bacterium]
MVLHPKQLLLPILRSDGIALKGIGDHLLERDLLKHIDLDEVHEVAKRDLLLDRFVRQKRYQVGTNGNPNLGFHSIQSVAKEVLDREILLEPFEEQFDLPALLINGSNGGCIQIKSVGQEDQIKFGFFIIKANPAQQL